MSRKSSRVAGGAGGAGRLGARLRHGRPAEQCDGFVHRQRRRAHVQSGVCRVRGDGISRRATPIRLNRSRTRRCRSYGASCRSGPEGSTRARTATRAEPQPVKTDIDKGQVVARRPAPAAKYEHEARTLTIRWRTPTSVTSVWESWLRRGYSSELLPPPPCSPRCLGAGWNSRQRNNQFSLHISRLKR